MRTPCESSGNSRPPKPGRMPIFLLDYRVAKSGELIEAARYVIAREGYAGASLRKVAARAGYSTCGYLLLRRQGEMVAAVADALFDEFDRWLDDQALPTYVRKVTRPGR